MWQGAVILDVVEEQRILLHEHDFIFWEALEVGVFP